MTNEWLIQQLDELGEKSEYQDRALLYEIKKLMAEIDERTTTVAREKSTDDLGIISTGEIFL
ncbi:hypothetical protein I8F73_04470 [Enterococcus faecalis]|nr:hypothetical protein [Enterococcus faecalis]